MSLAGFGKDVLGVLSGSQKVNGQWTQPGYAPTPNGVQEVNAPVDTGDMFKRMFAGMLSGLAGGVAANKAGAKGGMAAFAGGAGATINRNLQQGQNEEKLAEQQFQNQQEAQKDLTDQQLAAAQTSKINTDIATQGLKNSAVRMQLGEQQADRLNKWQQMVSTAPGAEWMGFAKDYQSLVNGKTPEERTALIQAHVKGTLYSVPTYAQDADGKFYQNGVEFYNVPAGWLDSKTDGVTKTFQPTVGKDGTETLEEHDIPSGSITNRQALSLEGKQIPGVITPSQIQSEKSAMDIAKERTKATMATLGARLELAEREGRILNSGDQDQLVKMVQNYDLDPKLLNRTARNAILAKLGPDWSYNDYQTIYNQKKDYTSGKVFTQLVSADQALQHVAAYDAIIKQLNGRTDSRTVNYVTQQVMKEFGDPDINSIGLLQSALASEFAKSMKGGEATDVQLKDLHTLIDPAAAPAARHAAAGELAGIVHAALSARAGEYRVPHAADDARGPHMSIAAQTSLNHFGYSDPFNYGKLPLAPANGSNVAPNWVLKEAITKFGNPAQAEAALKERGWQ